MIQVRKDEDVYRLMVESILDRAILMLDVNGRVSTWNAGAEQISGYKKKDILGQHFSLFYTEEDSQRGKPEQELLVATARDRFEDQGWRLRKDGSRYWAHVVITVMRDQSGDLAGFLMLIRDLTDQRNREQELRRSRERFQRAVESAPNAMVMINRSGRIELANLQAECVFGYSRDELLGRPIEMLIPARFRRRHPEHRMSFFANSTPRPMGVGLDLYALRKDGSEFPVEIGLNPIETDEGAMVLAAIVDITERKRREDELRRSEMRFRRVVESAPSAMLMVGPEGRIEMANLLAEQLFGYAREELLGQKVEMLIPERFRTQHPGLRAEFFSDPKARSMGVGRDLYALRKDGSEFPVEIGLNPIETEEGLRVLAAIVDITTRWEAQDALSRRAIELEKANERLARFAYVASHDLQEPLRKVVSFTELLNRAIASSDQSDVAYATNVLRTSALRARDLVEDLLLYTRTANEAQKLQDLDMREQIELALDDLSEAIRAASAEMQIDAPHLTIRADRTQFVRLVQNLVSNALKYRKLGQPVNVKLMARMDEDAIRLAVADDGIGIEPYYQRTIFEPFERLHPKAQYPGTGIGLAICKSIADRHGWDISVESQLGQGATFTVTIPATSERPDRGA
jgi:PAS domain S-box-containing protein